MILLSVCRTILSKNLFSLPREISIHKTEVIILTVRIHLNIHPSFYPINICLLSAYCITGSRQVTMEIKVPPSPLPQCLEPTGQIHHPEKCYMEDQSGIQNSLWGRKHAGTQAWGSGKDRVTNSSSVKSVIKNITAQIFKTDTTSNFNLMKHFHPTHTLVTCPPFLKHLKTSQSGIQLISTVRRSPNGKPGAFALDGRDKTNPRGQDNKTDI